MTYFKSNYNRLSYPLSDGNTAGLRNSQIGAIHSIASHFTTSDRNAIISMPTGTGKTAVLMMACYVLTAKRVLIITPSRLVRYQISDDLKELKTLKRLNVLPNNLTAPKVKEQDTKITSIEQWNALYGFDCIVSTPNCVSPEIEGVVSPSSDFFDLILIDEAHHSTAKTWAGILNSFENAKKILFSATPFRRDKKIIPGTIIYSYPLSKAFDDGDFGKIKFEPVVTRNAEDKHIAIKAQEVLRADRSRNLDHVLMVRTSTKTKANELVKIYSEETNLSLELVNSDQSYLDIKRSLVKLRKLEIDGIICVDMLGEGYDFPNLKIAAIHAPHKSLEVTLQFIGRFSRKGSNVDEAKFIAIPNDIEVEAERIYKEDSEWQELITNLSENRISDEIENRQTIENFSTEFVSDQTLKEISLFSLKPYFHVKILRPKSAVDFDAEISLDEFNLRVLRKDVNEDKGCIILIAGESISPRWSDTNQFDSLKYYLTVVYYDEENDLLFINSEIRTNDFYNSIGVQLTGEKPKLVPTNRVNKVLLALDNIEFFNVGVKNTSANNTDESYKIFSGSRAHKSIKKSDKLNYRRGHFFAKGTSNGKISTIGLSSASKVWSNQSSTISGFLKWLKSMSDLIASQKEVRTGTEIDYLSMPKDVDSIPESMIPITVRLDELVYKEHYKIFVLDEETELDFYDLEFEIDRVASNNDGIRFMILLNEMSFEFEFSFTTNKYFTYVGETEAVLDVGTSEFSRMSLEDFLNNYPIYFVFHDFSMLQLHDYHERIVDIAFDIESVTQIDWENLGVDVSSEFKDAEKGKVSIHDFLNDSFIPSLGYDYVFYDHRRGEAADFICLKVDEEKLLIHFYHVKATKSVGGNTVDDVYEVSSQVVRSVRYLNPERILDHVVHRENLVYDRKWKRDNSEDLLNLLSENDEKLQEYSIFLVQPGIIKDSITDNIANNLAAAADYCQPYQCKVITFGS